MKASLHRGNEYSAALLDLFACTAGFGVATWAVRAWLGPPAFASPWAFQWAFSAAIAWLAVVFPESSSRDGLSRWVDGFFTATGANLLVQYGLTYLFGTPAASWFLIVLGSALSLAAAGLLRAAINIAPGGQREGVLLVGCDSSTASLAAAFGENTVGVLDSGPTPASGELPFLGPPDRLDEVCETKHLRAVVMSGMPAGVSLARLLQLHYAGTEVEGSPFLCESVLRRVAWQQSLAVRPALFSDPRHQSCHAGFPGGVQEPVWSGAADRLRSGIDPGFAAERDFDWRRGHGAD